jgi:hypothetical protein
MKKFTRNMTKSIKDACCWHRVLSGHWFIRTDPISLQCIYAPHHFYVSSLIHLSLHFFLFFFFIQPLM